jgi:hypothetical protein
VSPEDEQLAAALTDMANTLWKRKTEIRQMLGAAGDARTLEDELTARTGSASIHSILDFVLDETTETRAKDAAPIEVVSPDVAGGQTPVSDFLAGEKLLHFFGFMLERARESDFGLGYRNMRAWWDTFAPDSTLSIPSHEFEGIVGGGSLSMRDVCPPWSRWLLTARIAARYLRELVMR